MKKMTMGEIGKAVSGLLICGNKNHTVSGISTDSRQASADSLFIPIIGEKHDAHDFIGDAAGNGCRCFLISRDGMPAGAGKNASVIKVDDTRKALQDLAKYYLNELGIRTIGITGSTGKTSTKDMTYAVCSTRYRTGRNLGNFNNDIGMPLTILGFAEDTQIGVLEMGMDKFGEIDELSAIAEPGIAMITNIGVSHMESLGSRENIFRAKMEITNHLRSEDVLIINEGEDFLKRENVCGDYRLISTGSGDGNDIIISEINDRGIDGIEFKLTCGSEVQDFILPVPGRHNAGNASLAVAAGMELGITMKEAAAGLAEMQLTRGRMTVIDAGGVRIIDDTYNASPDSVRAALDLLAATEGERRIAFLGDMYELGNNTEDMHRQTGRYAAEKGIDRVIAVGELARNIAEGAGASGTYYENKDICPAEDIVRTGDVVLVKGSRGMAMEEIVKRLSCGGNNSEI